MFPHLLTESCKIVVFHLYLTLSSFHETDDYTGIRVALFNDQNVLAIYRQLQYFSRQLLNPP